MKSFQVHSLNIKKASCHLLDNGNSRHHFTHAIQTKFGFNTHFYVMLVTSNKQIASLIFHLENIGEFTQVNEEAAFCNNKKLLFNLEIVYNLSKTEIKAIELYIQQR